MSCDNGLEQDITVAANTPAGDTSTTIDDLPVGTICTVTEPTDGSSTTVAVTTTVDGSPATITADQVTDVTVTNTYEEERSTPDSPSPSEPAEELASTGASAGLGTIAVLGIALLVGAGALLSSSRRRRRSGDAPTP